MMLEVINIKVKYRFGAVAIDNASFSVQNNQCFAVIGHEESGKTTLLKTIAGIIKPCKGQILFNGENFVKKSIKDRNVCLIHEDLGFFENKTLIYNLAYPLIIRGEDKELAEAKCLQLAKKYKIDSFLQTKVKKIPVDKKIVAAIARMELRNADIYLLDDIFKLATDRENLFQKYKPTIQNLCKKAIVIYATSSILEAQEIAQTALILNYGISHQNGNFETIKNNPASVFVYKLLNSDYSCVAGRTTIDITTGNILLNYDNHQIYLEKRKFLSDIFFDSEVLVLSKGNGTNIHIYDTTSEKLIYFE